MNAISIDHLTLGYGVTSVIENFSASVEPGEFIGIFGPNGAGKSTLLRALLGLIKPLSGHIRIFDALCRRGNPQIGYLSQFRQFAATNKLSGRAYLSAVSNGFRWGLPISSQVQKSEIENVIQLTRTQDFADRPYLQLSGGERQRLALAQALIGEPRILLLDEPLSSLDPAQQDKMVQLIQSIQQQLGITVLLTAHDMNPLLGVMKKVIYLTHGKAAIGTVDEVVNSETLSWLYSAPIKVVHLGEHLFVIHEKSGSNIHAHDHPFC